MELREAIKNIAAISQKLSASDKTLLDESLGTILAWGKTAIPTLGLTKKPKRRGRPRSTEHMAYAKPRAPRGAPRKYDAESYLMLISLVEAAKVASKQNNDNKALLWLLCRYSKQPDAPANLRRLSQYEIAKLVKRKTSKRLSDSRKKFSDQSMLLEMIKDNAPELSKKLFGVTD